MVETEGGHGALGSDWLTLHGISDWKGISASVFRGTVTLEFFRKDLLSEMCGGVPYYVYPVMMDESKTPGHQNTAGEASLRWTSSFLFLGSIDCSWWTSSVKPMTPPGTTDDTDDTTIPLVKLGTSPQDETMKP